jgi:hypothetical protein
MCAVRVDIETHRFPKHTVKYHRHSGEASQPCVRPAVQFRFALGGQAARMAYLGAGSEGSIRPEIQLRTAGFF